MSAKDVALIFPGQGSQFPGMGRGLYEAYPEARAVFDAADSVLGMGLKDKIFQGSEDELKRTEVTQPAIFAVSAAAFAALAARFPAYKQRTACAAGHSLGEYSALHAAEVFNFQTGLKLVSYRGQFIQEACRKNPGTMAAMIGFEREALAGLCRESADGGVLEMVNFNCPGQVVVAGTEDAIRRLLERAVSAPGGKAVPLSVSGAFHSRLMKEASERMAGVLLPAALRDAAIPVLANCDAQPTVRAEEIGAKLVRQIDHPVLWEESVRRMIRDGVGTFVEIGPGKVLSGLLRKIDRTKRALNVQDPESLEKAVAELAQA